jgi:hypothetical protein
MTTRSCAPVYILGGWWGEQDAVRIAGVHFLHNVVTGMRYYSRIRDVETELGANTNLECKGFRVSAPGAFTPCEIIDPVRVLYIQAAASRATRKRRARTIRVFVSACAAAITGIACHNATAPAVHPLPRAFNEVRPGGLTADASVSLVPSEGQLRASVWFFNTSPHTVTRSFTGGGCFVRVVVYRNPSLADPPLWNELVDPGNCIDIATMVVVPPHQSVEVTTMRPTPSRVSREIAHQSLFALVVLQDLDVPHLLSIAGGRVTVDE